MNQTQGSRLIEVGSEFSKCVSNFRLKLLERLYDGPSIVKGYEEGDVELHVHSRRSRNVEGLIEKQSLGSSVGENFCAVYTLSDNDRTVMGSQNQVPVLVWVRYGPKSARPVNSVVGLQLFNDCRMRRANTSQKSLTPSVEARLAILNRELCSILVSAGVKEGPFVDEVIQGRAEVPYGFAEQDGQLTRNWAFGSRDLEWHAGLRIDLNGSLGNFMLAINEVPSDLFEVRDVFHCPVKPSISAIKRMHKSI